MASLKKVVAPLCVMLVVFGVFLTVARADGHVCEGVQKPDPATIPCTINCLVADFVCGTDGRTYTCGCDDAFCHGVDVVKKGEC